MTIAFGASASIHASANVTTKTTGAITTAATGSGFIVMVQAQGSPLVTPTDSKGNTYVQIGTTSTYNFGGNRHQGLWYCANGTGGSGHTVTGGLGSGFVDMSVYFKEITTTIGSGITLDQNAALVTSGTFATPTFTTTVANEAVVAAFAGDSSATPATHTVSGGSFAIDGNCDITNWSTATFDMTGCIAGEIISSIQTITAATFTEANNNGGGISMMIASFSETGGGGGGGPTARAPMFHRTNRLWFV